MKIVLQRVSEAAVSVEDKITGKIENGYLALLGISNNDDKEKAEKAVEKILKLRIFPDNNGKTNLSSIEIDGELLVVSQFTLYADCKKGNRPSFISAGSPSHAEKIYNHFIEYAKQKFKKVESGIFGADMKVKLTNDGPFTVILEDGNGL